MANLNCTHGFHDHFSPDVVICLDEKGSHFQVRDTFCRDFTGWKQIDTPIIYIFNQIKVCAICAYSEPII